MTSATNVGGAIATAKQNQVAQATTQKSPATMMNTILNADSTKKLIENTCKENAGAFTASVLDLYTSDKLLQQCQPQQVFMEAMKAASLKLPINKQLGFAWIIPYKGTATFQIGYKGLIQLAMRTGLYKHLNAGPVYEGEFVSQDKLSGTVDLSGEATSDKVVGYFAHFKLLNGFERTMYWSRERVIAHASAYSQSYRSGNDIWKKNFDEMATKTLMRNLLKWAPLSVEFANALAEDDLTDTTDNYVEEYTPDNYEVIDNG